MTLKFPQITCSKFQNEFTAVIPYFSSSIEKNLKTTLLLNKL